MIPKIIHYCWFGGNPLPELAQTCIASWQKHCPDYEIIQWNENNYDFASAPLYVQQAYEARQWAFITDYVRLQVVFDRGGIYMDTDVELVKPLDSLLEHPCYFGFETSENIATGLGFGAESGAPILKDMMDDYQGIPFVLPDGSFDRTPCPQRNTQAFLRHGLVRDGSYQVLGDGILVLPREYLCPMDMQTGELHVTEHTLSIHHYSASWHSAEDRLFEQYRGRLSKVLPYKLSGYIARGMAAIRINGVSGLFARAAGFFHKRMK